MKRGKQRKTLEVVINNNGIISSRKKMIERKINEGWRLKEIPKYKKQGRGRVVVKDETEWALSKDRDYHVLNSTMKEYAEFLITENNLTLIK